MGKDPLANAGDIDASWILVVEDPLEKAMATHSSILGLQNPMDRVWCTKIHRTTKSQT